jgi:hypothetical protein
VAGVGVSVLGGWRRSECVWWLASECVSLVAESEECGWWLVSEECGWWLSRRWLVGG